MSKCPHWEKIKKLNLSLLYCHSVDLDYTTQKIIHTMRQRTPAKLSGNAEFLHIAAWAQSNIKDILSRNIPYVHNGPVAQSPALMPAGRSWQGWGGVRRGAVAAALNQGLSGFGDAMGSLQRQELCLCFCICKCEQCCNWVRSHNRHWEQNAPIVWFNEEERKDLADRSPLLLNN